MALALATVAILSISAAIATVEYNQYVFRTTDILVSLHSASTPQNEEEEGDAAPFTLEPFATFIQRVTFGWLGPLIQKGYKVPLDLPDIWGLIPLDKSSAAVCEYQHHERPGRSLWVTIAIANRSLVFFQLAAGVWMAALAFASPYFLNRLLDYLEYRQSLPGATLWEPYGYILGLFVCKCLAAVADGQADFCGRRIGLRTRAVVNSLMFRKTLTRSGSTSASVPASKKARVVVSKAVNDSSSASTMKEEPGEEEPGDHETDVNVLIGTDVQRIVDYICTLHYLMSAPVQLVAGIAGLYLVLGWSAFAGVFILAVVSPIQSYLGRIMEYKQETLMEATDARVNKMTEILQGIRIIKYFALETSFAAAVIQNLRTRELESLRSYWYTVCATNVIYHAVPTFITLLSMICYTVVAGHNLDATTVFTAVSLFAVLRVPLWDLPDQIIRYFETKVSAARIQRYLAEADMTDYCTPIDATKSIYIGARGATLRWPTAHFVTDAAPVTAQLTGSSSVTLLNTERSSSPAPSTSSAFYLRDIDLSFPRGKLSVILGPTGSGKSTLLHALLGELELVSGQVIMPRVPVAYVPQQSWLINATIKENICFHTPCDADRYAQVVQACALTRDLEILDGGDATQIGEKGVALSGGQKQRVSLARATYAHDSDIVVLDDVLSAVDAPTAAHLFNECIRGPIMEGKTRILVSHNVGLVAPHADFIVYVKDGRVVAQGRSMVEVIGQLETGGLKSEADAIAEVVTKDKRHLDDDAQIPGQKPADDVDLMATLDHQRNEVADQLIHDEEKAVGAVGSKVYLKYVLASGGWSAWAVILAGILIPQGLSAMQDWWLKNWAQSYTDGPKVDLGYYLGGYVGLCAANVVIQYGLSVFEVSANLRAAVTMHNAMLTRILGAPISFFDATPTGRLVNRFSRDMQTADREVLTSIGAFLWCLSSVVMVIGMVSAISPIFLLFIAPLAFAYRAIALQYLASSRELKRLESVTRSPIFSVFNETATGTSVVRAFGRQHEFQRKAERRMDTHHRMYFALWTSNRWLSIRLDGLSNLVIAACGIAVLLSGNLYAGTAGIALTWVQTISDSSLWLVRMHAAMEMNAVSVERIAEYSETVDQEPVGGTPPPADWPARGDLVVHNLTMKYPSSTTPVLRGVSFSVPGKTKVGVVGRTGAGKSSLALAMLRMLEAEDNDGYIEIDGVRTRDVPVHTLRSRITMVPQDPVLFEGTLRSNLDVLGEYDDATCWNALERVHFFESIHSSGTETSWTLESAVAAGGKNLSVGQRQLLSLARALVRRSKLIIMDESTANVSPDLDAKIQVTVRAEFTDSTILVIAHRLRTVCDFDKILVLDQGQVVEFGSPFELISRDQGTFRHMCVESGEYEHLVAMAWRCASVAKM
ncbi:P-loop containing nucleoside triphosphate hydrolase protein [Blastocladiella britannica]|nr:P-loop containing nucleoside triphosphate hydrolase protein [Blastocladiella britannica]